MYFKLKARSCSSSGTQSGRVVVEVVAVAVLVVLVVVVVVVVLVVIIVVVVLVGVVVLEMVGIVVVVAVVFVSGSCGQIGTPASMNSGYESKSCSSCRIQSGSVMVGMGSVDFVVDFLGVVTVAVVVVVVDLVGKVSGFSGTRYS